MAGKVHKAFHRGHLLKKVENTSLKKDKDLEAIPAFEVGDQVDIHQWILEGFDKEGNEKRRIQIYSGVVIAKTGTSSREAFTVRRIVDGQGVERLFPLHSPKIAKIVVKRTGRVRRAKLYYLRDRVGKATRLRERRKGVTIDTSSSDVPANRANNGDLLAKEGKSNSNKA